LVKAQPVALFGENNQQTATPFAIAPSHLKTPHTAAGFIPLLSNL